MKVYISHSRRDALAASAVLAKLRAAGHEVLVDRDELTPGEDFGRVIEKMIDEANVVLVLWSAASISSSLVRAEATHAFRLDKFLGFTLGDVSLPLPFNVIHHHHLATDGSETESGMIVAAIEAISERTSAPRAAKRATRPDVVMPLEPIPIPRKARAQSPIPREEVELEIPSFLRRSSQVAREEQAAEEAPAAATPVVEAPAPVVAGSPMFADAGVAPAEPGYDVFISYSRKDEAACKLAFELMAERGLVPWYDKDVGGGAFKQKIVTRISKAAVFVLLLSKNSVGSPNVSKELSVAVDERRLVIPISIDGIAPRDLADTFKYELTELNIFNANPAAPETWSEVIRTVAESVAQLRAEAGVAPVAAVRPLALAEAPAKAGKARRPWLFAGVTVVSGLLQQAAVGFALWWSGVAGVELSVALAVASGAVVWPLAYGAAALARLAFRRSGG